MGMAGRHSSFEEFHLDDYEKKRRYERYHVLLRKYYNGKVALSPEQAKKLEQLVRGVHNRVSTRHRLKRSCRLSWLAEVGTSQFTPSSLQHEVASLTEDSQNSHEPIGPDVDDIDFENEISSFLDCCILQRLSIKKRKFLLQKSGTRQLDHSDRADCQTIRESREVCGCSCPDGICLPEHCQCALNNVICQIDSLSFPCSCIQASACANPEGRLEFNQRRVRVHYIHTRMRLFSENLSDEGTPSKVVTLEVGDGDEDNNEECFLGKKEKRQRLEIFSDKSPQREELQATTQTFNSSIKGSCVLCDDADFVEQCAKIFNVPSTAVPTSSWQSHSLGDGVQTDHEASASTSTGQVPAPLWHPMDPVTVVELGHPSGQFCDNPPPDLFAAAGEGTVLRPHFRCCSDPNVCDDCLPVAYTEGPSASEAIGREYELDLRADQTVSGGAAGIEKTALSTQVVPLAPITCLLPKLSPDAAPSNGAVETAYASPRDTSREGGDRYPDLVSLGQPTKLRSPVGDGQPGASSLTFSALAEEVLA